MWARRRFDEVRVLKSRVQLVLGGIGLLIIAAVAVIGPSGVAWLFGPGFEMVYYLLLTQLVAVVLVLIGSSSRSALLAMNKPTFVLMIAFVATATFMSSAFVLIPKVGAIGANLAHIAFALVTVLMLEIGFRRAFRSQDAGRMPA